MESESVKVQQLLDAVESLRQQVGGLVERIERLETAAPAASGAPAGTTGTRTTGLDDELAMTISAAIAAYLGCKPHIRQIRLLGNASWAEHGRASIQASHSFSPHDR
jgi:methylmalonyl-CoA carboxyltransferase large subunit